jgi:HipA-like protein
VLLPLRHGAATAANGLRLIAEQHLQRHLQRRGEHRQHGHRNAPATGLVALNGLLLHAEHIGELGLRHVARLAELGNAVAHLDGELALIGTDSEHYVDHQFVGTLREDNNLWVFEYDPAWSAHPQGFDLSPALPRDVAKHRDGGSVRPVQWYFDNLLPEEDL